MDILKHFIMFYFGQNILLFLILLIPELKYAREHKEEILKLKALLNTVKFILIGVPLLVYEAAKDM